MMKIALALAVASMLLVTTLATTASADSKTNRVSISYVPPKDPLKVSAARSSSI